MTNFAQFQIDFLPLWWHERSGIHSDMKGMPPHCAFIGCYFIGLVADRYNSYVYDNAFNYIWLITFIFLGQSKHIFAIICGLCSFKITINVNDILYNMSLPKTRKIEYICFANEISFWWFSMCQYVGEKS